MRFTLIILVLPLVSCETPVAYQGATPAEIILEDKVMRDLHRHAR